MQIALRYNHTFNNNSNHHQILKDVYEYRNSINYKFKINNIRLIIYIYLKLIIKNLIVFNLVIYINFILILIEI